MPGYQALTPDAELDTVQFPVRLTRVQIAIVAEIASQETSSRTAIIRRLVNDGLRQHQRVQRLRERAGV